MQEERDTATPPAAPAEGAAAAGRLRVLDPIDRNSEVLFGLLMVLTFTGTLSVVESGREDVRTMLVAAIGCNAAWGFVDAVMYVLRTLVARGRKVQLKRAVQAARRPEEGRRIIADEIGPVAEGLGRAGPRARAAMDRRPAAAGQVGAESPDAARPESGPGRVPAGVRLDLPGRCCPSSSSPTCRSPSACPRWSPSR